MIPVFESHVHCTSVKCAAVVHVFGGKFRQPDPITHEILADDSEEIKYFFKADPANGFLIADLISAYSILSRGIPPGHVPRRETLAILESKDHPIHACFSALNERDRFHRLYFEAAKGNLRVPEGPTFSTKETMLAACLSALGHKEIGWTFDGKSAWFHFRPDPVVHQMAEAFTAAWATMLLPLAHPLYWMKSVLERRKELVDYKNGKLRDLNNRTLEPCYRENQGMRTILTPVHTSPENLEKSKKYLNA